ncbi:hypothetical protein A3A05_03110 [Candidatus Nomurabacteria bacterium RIFCSPLOWO2_01_FULL_41_12]|uniref:Pyridoxamine 5'-phosphate oxidase N-terminal domain-containing protein n=1 Tax=Candidatus Nomurabacteria bacterium RIFCSPLOWO2_01_FULL_41_12 TaxID=1801774 RepID=A0A1F6WV72_9BACT|nr:MAG: hypothetical protein A3A05_03110 [Candidatus Nomurabacteria bacterium RIFCSPLOWO2_01_FULL_41_12]
MDNKLLEEIIFFLKGDKQKLCTVSTVTEDRKPESAFVYYTFDENLNIYFITRAGSRKYKNGMKNPNISFVVFTENPPKTLQLEGTLSIVTDPKAQTWLFPELVTLATERNLVPPISQMDTSEVMFMKITPNWVRFGNFELGRNDGMFQEIKIKG